MKQRLCTFYENFVYYKKAYGGYGVASKERVRDIIYVSNNLLAKPGEQKEEMYWALHYTEPSCTGIPNLKTVNTSLMV